MMNWFNKLFASKTTKFYSGDNIGTVFTDMNKEDMDRRWHDLWQEAACQCHAERKKMAM